MSDLNVFDDDHAMPCEVTDAGHGFVATFCTAVLAVFAAMAIAHWIAGV